MANSIQRPSDFAHNVYLADQVVAIGFSNVILGGWIDCRGWNWLHYIFSIENQTHVDTISAVHQASPSNSSGGVPTSSSGHSGGWVTVEVYNASSNGYDQFIYTQAMPESLLTSGTETMQIAVPVHNQYMRLGFYANATPASNEKIHILYYRRTT